MRYEMMPKYFFNVFHKEPQHDLTGMDLPDKNAAWEQATKTAGEILKEIDGDLQPGRPWRMEVTDEFKQKLFAIHIGAERMD